MDTLYYNGKIKTLDNKNSIVEAIGIKSGKIVFLGSNSEASNIKCGKRVDLNGRLLLPGFIDSHLHMAHFAFVENTVKLFDCNSADEAVMTLKKYSEKDENKELKWFFARGWNEENFPNKRFPTKAELDTISSKVPVLMVRVCGHIAVTNSVGLTLLKKMREFDEVKSEIDFNTGVIKENAVQFFYSLLEKYSQSKVEYLLKYSFKELNKAGITGIQSDDLSSLPGKDWQLIINAYNSLQLKNDMTVRVYEQCIFEKIENFKNFLARGYRTGQGGEFFTIGPLKLIQDGSLGAKTAALLEDYEGTKHNKGIVNFSQDELDEIVDLASKNDMQIAIHCIGDRAMNMVIQSLEKAYKKYNLNDRRNGIVHAQITNQEIIDKMKENKIIAYVQPVFVDLDMDIVEPLIGKNRINKIYAWKTLLDSGIPTLGGSDAPVVSFNVVENIYFAVTRQKLDGTPIKGWIPEECLDIEEAVKLFTKYPAYASYTEDINGTLEIGKRADLVVLDKDIYLTNPADIKNIKVDLTIVNGKEVYNRALS